MRKEIMNIYIPFAGFYETLYSAEIDTEIERLCEHMDCECDDLKIDYRAIQNHIAYEYARTFFELIEKETDKVLPDIDPQRKDVTLYSPRFYNFETDSIEVRVPYYKFVRLLSSVANDKDLRETMRDRHTSCDGFYSHYSNELEDWPTSVCDWDSIQCETLLLAALRSLEIDLENLEDAVFYKLIDKGVFYDAVNENAGLKEADK